VSLTIGPGPFSNGNRGVLSAGEVPRGAAYAEPYPRRVRALLGGRALLDTDKAWMVHGPGFGAELWFPRDKVDASGLASTALTEFEQAGDPVSRALAGFVKLSFTAADRWFVEDEPVYAEARAKEKEKGVAVEDVVGTFRRMTVPFITNTGYDRAKENAVLAVDEADLVAYGVPYIANPDLVGRFRADAALNRPNPALFYGVGAEGYTDYPTMAETRREPAMAAR
jgi:hypothetical protein